MTSAQGPVFKAPDSVRRGLILVVTAVVIGFLLLSARNDPVQVVAGNTTDAPTSTSSGVPSTTELPTPLPPDITVQVANAGTGISGAAGRVTDQLETLGYNTVEPTNTIDETLEDSLLLYGPGFFANAKALAADLGLGDDAVQPMPTDPASLVQDYLDPDVMMLLGLTEAEAANPTDTGAGTTSTVTTDTTALGEE
jgi:LytR cell envelope-related transcriptional attenuator